MASMNKHASKFDPFDLRIIEILNVKLHETCPELSFYYKCDSYLDRMIYIYNNTTGVQLSYMDLTKVQRNDNKEGTGTITIRISRTRPGYGQNNLNKCLRFLAAIIASIEHCYLLSQAISFASLHLMYTYFDTEIQNKDGDFVKMVLTPDQLLTMLPKGDHYVNIRVIPGVTELLLKHLLLIIPTIACPPNAEKFGGSRKRKQKRKLKRKKTKKH